jgi:hypothetical protein
MVFIVDGSFQRNFKKQISEPVDLSLNKAAPDMWDDILRTFRRTLDKAEASYLAKATSSLFLMLFFACAHHVIGFNCTDEENANSLAALRRRAWQALRAKIDEQTAEPVILGKLRSHFEERFRYDETGVPRVWKPEDDIDGAFKKAKDEVCVIYLCT